ncbi:hypothetical protein NMY22_g6766 [Coprinellus aureogranulatus]|nr:hypothetical protein NMY22_g6766 [Coprinellus aureogranulatus]
MPASTKILNLELPRWETRKAGLLRPTTFCLPWNALMDLTTLNLTCDWPKNLIWEALLCCMKLEVLKLDLGDGEFCSYEEGHEDFQVFLQKIADGSVLPLPHLHTFCIDQAPAESVEDLCSLQLSSLRNLSISFGDRERYGTQRTSIIVEELAGAFAAVLTGNIVDPSKLEALRISNVIIPDDTLVEALRDLLVLKHLTLENVSFPRYLFQDVLWLGLLPKLETLEILGHYHRIEEMCGLQDNRIRVNRKGCIWNSGHCPGTGRMPRSKGLPKTMVVRASECGGVAAFYDTYSCSMYAGKRKCAFSNPILTKLLKDDPSLNVTVVAIACPTSQCFSHLPQACELALLAESRVPTRDLVESIEIDAPWGAVGRNPN